MYRGTRRTKRTFAQSSCLLPSYLCVAADVLGAELDVQVHAVGHTVTGQTVSADLTGVDAGNNGVKVKGAEIQSRVTPGGIQLHYGIREHGMGSTMNGMAQHRGPAWSMSRCMNR